MSFRPSNDDQVLRATGVWKSYDNQTVTVLSGVDFHASGGETIALCGPSGCGKSTLLHLLGGLDVPDAGEISFAGKDLAKLSAAKLAAFRNFKVGFVFQAYHLLPELTALENVCLPARIARVSVGDAAKRGRELLARVGLGERVEHRPYELSGGEQQRVAIARALINSPELLLADEPTGNLDSKAGGEIIELLKSLRAEKNTTLIIATHDARVAAHAERVIELVDGRIAT